MRAEPQPDPDLLAHCRTLRAQSKLLTADAVSLQHRSRFLHSRVRWVNGRLNDLLTISVFQQRIVVRTRARRAERMLA
jgi:hypothetical protein